MITPAPKVCLYCHGTGQADSANECGFCEGGVPLDTQEDWDRTWGRVLHTSPNNPTNNQGASE